MGAGEERGGGAELRVTRDFGRERLGSARLERVREGQTVMRFLQSERRVETRYGGNFVESIDGLEGAGSGGSRDWFYFVNGIEAEVGASDRELSPGEVVQWDHRQWVAAMRVPAIVGAYPEPFRSGVEGKRLPTRVECEDERSAPCREVKRRLGREGVTVTGSSPGGAAGDEVLRVLVAPWEAIREGQAAAMLERGPADSGIFVRFAEDGRFDLLDERGRVVSREGGGAGLVAATRLPGQGVVWFVTGADQAGVAAAARALDRRALRDAFAVAATPRGIVRLPVGRKGRS